MSKKAVEASEAQAEETNEEVENSEAEETDTEASEEPQVSLASDTSIPHSQTVWQADQAVRGDYIVEYVEKSEHVTFHPESGGSFHPLNEQRTIPTLHTRVYSVEVMGKKGAKAAAEAFAATKPRARIIVK